MLLEPLLIEAVKPQPFMAACSIFTLCRIEIKQMTCDGSFMQILSSTPTQPVPGWLNISHNIPFNQIRRHPQEKPGLSEELLGGGWTEAGKEPCPLAHLGFLAGEIPVN